MNCWYCRIRRAPDTTRTRPNSDITYGNMTCGSTLPRLSYCAVVCLNNMTTAVRMYNCCSPVSPAPM